MAKDSGSFRDRDLSRLRDMPTPSMSPRTFRESAYTGAGRNERPKKYELGLVFVGMAFDLSSNMSDTYQAIKRACEAASLRPLRVDDIQDSGPIPVQIMDAIERAQFLVFDLSVERPNVYYELGYAHGVGNRAEHVVLTARNDADIHFDVAHLRILRYVSAIDLENKITERLHEMVKQWQWDAI